jgi:hypothetical protein
MKALTSLIVTASLVTGGVIVWKACGDAVASPSQAEAPVATLAVVSKPFPITETSVAPKPDAASVAAPAEPKVAFEDTELIVGAQQGIVQASLRGNGRDRLSAQLRNNSANPLRVRVPAGQVLESGRNHVIVLRTAEAELMPAQSIELSLATAALHSANKVGDAPYKLSYQGAPKVAAFLGWLADHPEVATPTAQTAVLALIENLPVNAVAKFSPVNGVTSRFNTDAFRVETGDIIAALSALRDAGVRIDTLAMSVDPQLRIEAMIEPLSRESAKRYYGISEEREWDFWKNELLTGDPSTRHYALFGVARFYPEIALEMLPKWVREPKTHPVYRMSAIQALADTQRPEALPVLRQLVEDLGADTDLGKAAAQAAGYLDSRLSQLASASPVVAFRGTSSTEKF